MRTVDLSTISLPNQRVEVIRRLYDAVKSILVAMATSVEQTDQEVITLHLATDGRIIRSLVRLDTTGTLTIEAALQ